MGRADKLRDALLCTVVALAATGRTNVANGQTGSGWLLWHHTYTTRTPKGVKLADYAKYVIRNDWVILNAVDTRDQCRSLLREEFSKKRDWMATQMTGSEGTVNQSPLADGISASLWFGRDIKFGPTGIDMRLGMEQDFWCLPAAVDPRNVRIDRLEEQ